ncbi:hypothetical protein LNP74_28125 [Klebsiella pneumoniae subsp. pneumoniae]|nr:hypothetical protein [Klebsiella pneumoniae subsp. pneumoniae]
MPSVYVIQQGKEEATNPWRSRLAVFKQVHHDGAALPERRRFLTAGARRRRHNPIAACQVRIYFYRCCWGTTARSRGCYWDSSALPAFRRRYQRSVTATYSSSRSALASRSAESGEVCNNRWTARPRYGY